MRVLEQERLRTSRHASYLTSDNFNNSSKYLSFRIVFELSGKYHASQITYYVLRHTYYVNDIKHANFLVMKLQSVYDQFLLNRVRNKWENSRIPDTFLYYFALRSLYKISYLTLSTLHYILSFHQIAIKVGRTYRVTRYTSFYDFSHTMRTDFSTQYRETMI